MLQIIGRTRSDACREEMFYAFVFWGECRRGVKTERDDSTINHIAQEKEELSLTIPFLSFPVVAVSHRLPKKKKKNRSTFCSLRAECFVSIHGRAFGFSRSRHNKAAYERVLFFPLRTTKGVTNRLLF